LFFIQTYLFYVQLYYRELYYSPTNILMKIIRNEFVFLISICLVYGVPPLARLQKHWPIFYAVRVYVIVATFKAPKHYKLFKRDREF